MSFGDQEGANGNPGQRKIDQDSSWVPARNIGVYDFMASA